jgi:hypothetical protein
LSRPLIIFNGAPRLTAAFGNNIGPCLNGEIIGNSTRYCLPGPNTPNPIIRAEDLAGLGAPSNFLLTYNVDRPDAKANLRYYQFNFYGQDTWQVRNNLSLSYGLRYEYNSPVHEVDGLIEQTFSDSRLQQPYLRQFNSGLDNFIGGRETLYESDLNNFAPRVGVAFSPNIFGNNRVSVFRAGYGIFYDQILGAVVNQSRNVFPTFTTVDTGGAPPSPVRLPGSFLSFSNPGGIFAPSSGVDCSNGRCIPCNGLIVNGVCSGSLDIGLSFFYVLPGTINTLIPELQNSPPRTTGGITIPERELEMPMAHHYSFVYEQQLNAQFTFSVGYIGTTGRKLLRFTTPNLGASKIIVPAFFERGGH